MFSSVFFLGFLLFAQAQWQFEEDVNSDICKTPDQKTGTCISIYSCRTMLEALDQIPKPIPPEVHNYLDSYRCGFEGRYPKVCCPSTPININQNRNPVEEDKFPDVSAHKNINLLPKNCGYLNTDDKIVNGQKARLFEFPWMALLSYRTQNGPQFKCGGTIINDRYILTAAHCLANLRDPLLGVRVGEHNIKTAIDCETDKWEGEKCSPPHQDLSIERKIIHPNYNPKLFTDDIGLIKVSRINLSLQNSRPVCLPLEETRNYNFTNRNAIVTGWGLTEKGRPSSDLLKVSLAYVPLERCKKKYETKSKLDHRQICAGGKDGKDSCGGDSGGPLHVIGKLGGEIRLVQQGIVSFGPSNCGRSTIPGVYTRVAAFMDWILNNIDA